MVPVLHRDIKSGNLGLAVLPDGSFYAKLLDCGVAKLLQDSTPSGYSTVSTGPIAPGTRAYMPPELMYVLHVSARTSTPSASCCWSY